MHRRMFNCSLAAFGIVPSLPLFDSKKEVQSTSCDKCRSRTLASCTCDEDRWCLRISRGISEDYDDAEIVGYDKEGILAVPKCLENETDLDQTILIPWKNKMSGYLVHGIFNGKKVYGVADTDNFPDTHTVRLYLCERVPRSQPIMKLIKLA